MAGRGGGRQEVAAWLDVTQQPARMDERQLHQRTRGAQQDARFKAVARWITSVDRGRGTIKKRTAQIKKRTVWRPAKKVSMMGAADNRAGSRWQSRECNNQLLMGVVKASSGWQWQE
jgi:hypothetical protein